MATSGIRAHFVGANGIPYRVYTPMLRALRQKAIHAEGSDVHDVLLGPNQTVGHVAGWDSMISRLCQDVERNGGGAPVVGIGHSFGGAMMLCASALRPSLFSQLLLFDPPLFTMRTRALFQIFMQLVPLSAMGSVFPPISSALRRRNQWGSREEAREYLQSKNMFKAMHPDVFDAFIQFGLYDKEPGKGCSLAFPPVLEAKIYATVPLDVPLLSPSRYGIYKGGTPGWYVYSTQHTLTSKQDVAAQRTNLSSLDFVACSRPHYFPLQQPDDFADMVASILRGEKHRYGA